MTIREFAEGYLAGKYYFERPRHGAGTNKVFTNFINALVQYVDYKYYSPPGSNRRTFYDYAMSGCRFKYFNTYNKLCTGALVENSAFLEGKLRINFEDVDFDCNYGMNFEELL